ncbi:MAG: glycerate kinase [Chitinispirillaceae bacterium]
MEKRDSILQIFKAGLKAAEPAAAMRRIMKRENNRLLVRTDGVSTQSYDLDQYSSIMVFGCGKAAASMAQFSEELLGDRIAAGLVAVKYGYSGTGTLRKIHLIEGGHPWPDQMCVNATSETVKILGSARNTDLIIALLSGGGSSLWTLPASGIQLEDLVSLSKLLLASGADIREMNIVRKHFSRIKGGQAAVWACPAQVLAVVVSDVPGDSFHTIASGPFSPDASTFSDVSDILNKYSLTDRIPASVAEHLREGMLNGTGETPKAGNSCFHNVLHVLAASNKSALEACRAEAEKMGYRTHLIQTPLTGEAKEASVRICTKIKELSQSESPVCIVAGGETTVSLGEKHGNGGRNQELALAAALQLENEDRVTLLSCGTDGNDGPTDAAGAVVNGRTAEMMRKQGIDPENHLLAHDSYAALEAAGCLVKTGPTNTNVMDIQIALIS